ncbi:hypothetical protein ACFL3V_04300 [Nanoarchaeota archaeon]
MSLEPTIAINGLSQLAAAFLSLRLALRYKKEKSCLMTKPLFFLTGTLIALSILNLLWATGAIAISELDNMLIAPFFQLAFLAVWFYICLFISAHDHIYYFIPIFIMSANAILLLKNLSIFCDMVTGLTLIGVFFYMGFIDHHHVKKISYTGMAYGAAIIAVSAAAQLSSTQYLNAFWFIPNIILIYLLWRMLHKGDICDHYTTEKHHIPVIVEVFKFGFFVIGLSSFLMLGILGVHELGHSLMAKLFSCAHTTDFGIGYAVTHVVCESGFGATPIILGGLILTILISLLMYFMGNDFAKRMSFLLIAFSLLIAIDDFTALKLPYSLIITAVLISTLLIGYGIVLIVKNYEVEYEAYEAKVCSSIPCGKETNLKPDQHY